MPVVLDSVGKVILLHHNGTINIFPMINSPLDNGIVTFQKWDLNESTLELMNGVSKDMVVGQFDVAGFDPAGNLITTYFDSSYLFDAFVQIRNPNTLDIIGETAMTGWPISSSYNKACLMGNKLVFPTFMVDLSISPLTPIPYTAAEVGSWFPDGTHAYLDGDLFSVDAPAEFSRANFPGVQPVSFMVDGNVLFVWNSDEIT